MIKRLEIRNFKLHENSVIDLKPVTFLIGPNNSGKSSVLQALQLIKQASINKGRAILSPNTLIDVGSFQDVVRDKKAPIKFSIKGNLLKDYADLGISISADGISSHQGQIQAGNNRPLNWDMSTLAPKTFEWSYPVKDSQAKVQIRENVGFPLLTFVNKSANFPFSDEEDRDIPNAISNILDMPRRLIESVNVAYPLRGLESARYEIPKKSPDIVENRELNQRSVAIGAKIAYNRELEDQLSVWAEQLFGFTFKLHLTEGPNAEMRIQRIGHGRSLLSNEGSGANQLPYILIPLFLTPIDGTFLIYEPEAHLHPKGQAELMRLILKSYLQERKQFLMETHSDHVLHSFLYAIKKKQIPLQDVAIYYFGEPSDRKVIFRSLEITEQGQVKGGLPGFFDQTLREAQELMEPVGPDQ